MDRKRGIALADTPGDGDSPTKRQRVGEHRAEHFGSRASNDCRFVPLETDSSQFSPLDHGSGKVFSSDSYDLDSDSSASPTHGGKRHSRALFRAHTINEMLTGIAEPTVDQGEESECEDFVNDIVNNHPEYTWKGDSSDRSQLGKRALVKQLLRKQGDEMFVRHEEHPENPGRQWNNTHAVRTDDTSKGLRLLHLSTETGSAGSPSDGLTQHDPPVSHTGPDQSELEQGTEITISAKFRLDVETLVCIPTSELSTSVDVSTGFSLIYVHPNTALSLSATMDPKFLDTTAALEKFLSDLGNCDGQSPRLYVDLEGNNLSRNGTLSLVTILRRDYTRARCLHYRRWTQSYAESSSSENPVTHGCIPRRTTGAYLRLSKVPLSDRVWLICHSLRESLAAENEAGAVVHPVPGRADGVRVLGAEHPNGHPSLRIGNNLITGMLQIDMTPITPSVEISFVCSDCHDDESNDEN
ncbi:hypothetical protein LTS09_017660 [Friedmanniomyces endolithicus]|nr:hypothetical protein LTS09_017660 [Friedmanniomyces endolithicus]